MILEIIIFTLSSIVMYHFYVYKKLHYHFDKWGVKYKPGIPIFGNTFWSTISVRHVVDDLEAVYKEFPDEKYVGYIEGNKPVIIVRDPELMKLITIKHFNHFVNRKDVFPKEIEPLLGCSILSMKDDEWRVMRGRLSLAFNGSKMKNMLLVMIEISRKFVEYLKAHQSEDIDVIDLMRRYSTDVIASTGFGLHVDSLKDRLNEFYIIGEKAVQFSFWKKMYYFFTIQFPIIARIMECLGIQLLSPQGTQFFRRIVADTIEYRKKNNVVRPDFIHLLMEAKQDWALDDITGQVFFAFLASYESVAATLTMCIHEIALHPDCEERLYQEIKAHQIRNGELTYDNISELKFLDCVLNESSRKWSVALMMDRVCTKAYTLPPPRKGGQAYPMRPGDLIYGPVNAVQMDPKHHPNPEIFNPDRFSEPNKGKIESFTFMPFGMGPRSCLGMRYSLLEMKTILYHLILNFKITACKKTWNPIRLQPGDFIIRAVGETFVRFESRV